MQLHAIYYLENLEGTLKDRLADTNRQKFVNGKFERALAIAESAKGKRIFRHVSARIFFLLCGVSESRSLSKMKAQSLNVLLQPRSL